MSSKRKSCSRCSSVVRILAPHELRSSGHRGCEQATQTQSDEPEVVCRDAAELDTAFREVGEKGRELRKAQELNRQLKAEFEEQRLLADQYREQVEILEAQVKTAMQIRRCGVDKADAAAPRPSNVQRRPSQARRIRPSSDESDED